MKHISIAAKISISITERQQNLNTLANFFSEYIINNNVNFQIDVFCWVLGMPPRQSVTAEETQIIDSVTEQENEQNFEPESAPIILLSQLRINQTARLNSSVYICYNKTQRFVFQCLSKLKSRPFIT